ncbi:MAG: twin-arginine translocase TatA/TatE family subunit, partial [Desulfovibrionaceae bacterium]|nr:twin-arginine translocase TatA/TatE family subunit [Desulfovibrionaceae bacterium]
MFGIGSTELLVILLVGLIVLGPKSLASLSRTLGKVVGEFRRVSTDFQRTLNAEAAAEEVVKDQSLIAEPAEKVEEANEEELRRAKLEARKNEALAKAQAAKES